jgi:tRNA(Arg) A34 adenosine deaminase TadA
MINMDKYKKFVFRTIEISKRAVVNGNNPFGALLLSGDNKILLEQENVERTTGDCTGHAETALMRKASMKYSKEFLKECKLVTIAEPCVMCSGAIYWGNIGTVIYGLSEMKLLELTGDNPLNPTFAMPCRTVFAAGQKDINVIGPIFEQDIIDAVTPFWVNN